MGHKQRLSDNHHEIASLPGRPVRTIDCHFVAEPFRQVEDAAERRARLASKVAVAIAPRLEPLLTALPIEHPTAANITELAQHVLGPDEGRAVAYVTDLRARGLPIEALFGELLEPAAELLGELWNQDDIDFIDVTLGVARLQAILWLFNGQHELTPASEARQVLMLTPGGEQHSFGIAMVERCLEAGGWNVISERGPSQEQVIDLVERSWIGVAGIAISSRKSLDPAASLIRTIRKHSRNREIGVMVGGPIFKMDPALASSIGADGTSASGPTAVVLAQKLLDRALVSQHSAQA